MLLTSISSRTWTFTAVESEASILFVVVMVTADPRLTHLREGIEILQVGQSHSRTLNKEHKYQNLIACSIKD